MFLHCTNEMNKCTNYYHLILSKLSVSDKPRFTCFQIIRSGKALFRTAKDLLWPEATQEYLMTPLGQPNIFSIMEAALYFVANKGCIILKYNRGTVKILPVVAAPIFPEPYLPIWSIPVAVRQNGDYNSPHAASDLDQPKVLLMYMSIPEAC